MEWSVKTADGRTLAVEDAGDRSGPPVLVHVGSPGYGESTPQPGRTTADCAADVRAQGLDWLAGMGPGAEEDVRLMFGDRDVARAAFTEEREQLLATSPAELARKREKTAPDADLAFLTDEAICVQQALSAGIEGFHGDNWAQLIPWGFDVAEISVPVLLLHGRRDKSVPVGHGQWLADHIPGVEARCYDNEGHGLPVVLPTAIPGRRSAASTMRAA